MQQDILSDSFHISRSKFLFGCILDKSSIAFTQPTEAGKALVERYCDRVDFLVYNSEEIDDV